MKNKLTVGIFGYYSYRNLGDNLMAYLLSKQIRNTGHVPLVFSKFADNMQDWGVELVSDVKEFVEQADLVIFGGGGLLIPRKSLSGEGADFNEDLHDVLEMVEANGTPLYGISLGGGGKPLSQIVPEERRRLIRSLNYLTLRNREDMQLLEQAGIKGEFLDDLVWTTAKSFPLTPPASNGRRRIGINLYLGRSRRFKVLRKIIEMAVRLRSDMDFVFFDIHPGRNDEFKAYSPDRLPRNCERRQLVDMEDACRQAASLDLLLTTRLHLGVMAMSYGVTTIAYAGQEKTRLLYNRIGRGELFWRSGKIFNFIKLFFFPGQLDKTLERQTAIDDAIIDNASSHYDRLAEILDSEASGKSYSGASGLG